MPKSVRIKGIIRVHATLLVTLLVGRLVGQPVHPLVRPYNGLLFSPKGDLTFVTDPAQRT